jgi:hypothetical protein
MLSYTTSLSNVFDENFKALCIVTVLYRDKGIPVSDEIFRGSGPVRLLLLFGTNDGRASGRIENGPYPGPAWIEDKRSDVGFQRR